MPVTEERRRAWTAACRSVYTVLRLIIFSSFGTII
jgi:hypothetical protein